MSASFWSGAKSKPESEAPAEDGYRHLLSPQTRAKLAAEEARVAKAIEVLRKAGHLSRPKETTNDRESTS